MRNMMLAAGFLLGAVLLVGCGPGGAPRGGVSQAPSTLNSGMGQAPRASGPNGGPGIREGSGASSNP
ncbi:hypothetical protein M0638_20920 [Roseomonas sp. NAR14]|uniref:Lipoprotein n=1 Tax=Roseomonas acroporae TaxID=2937791 RepID=A0A9X2BYD1_9PROT|nr:hypothetical protein [Roseomonas acroporae]MCK8786839.1 hypothetical protein [Roseomonas acroporae]